MFKRRRELHPFHKMREFFWPKSGWHRTGRYLGYRVVRLSGTPYSIAAGFACGAAISFTPFVSLHFILGALLAWLIGGHILASLIGTAVGNPWTFPFIWLWIYKLGVWISVGNGFAVAEDVDFARFFGNTLDAALSLDIAYLLETVWPVWWPMFVGGIPTAAVVWFVTYWPLRRAVAFYQAHRDRKIQRRREELNNR